jgi:Rieske Fe-S protein
MVPAVAFMIVEVDPLAQASEAPRRRDWLSTCLKGIIAATVAVLLYPVARFLRPRPQTSSGALEVVAPYRPKELKPDARGHWPPPFDFAGKPCLVIRTPEGDVRAFNAVCTHLDCTVEFHADRNEIFCNCHNGVYDLLGRNVSGPPPRPLEPYKVVLRGESGQEEIIVSRST